MLLGIEGFCVVSWKKGLFTIQCLVIRLFSNYSADRMCTCLWGWMARWCWLNMSVIFFYGLGWMVLQLCWEIVFFFFRFRKARWKTRKSSQCTGQSQLTDWKSWMADNDTFLTWLTSKQKIFYKTDWTKYNLDRLVVLYDWHIWLIDWQSIFFGWQ